MSKKITQDLPKEAIKLIESGVGFVLITLESRIIHKLTATDLLVAREDITKELQKHF